MIKRDYIMNQIEAFGKMLAGLFGKEISQMALTFEQLTDTAAVDLHSRLISLVKDGQLCEAEDMLYEEMDISDMNYFAVGLDFYTRLNDFSDEFLESNNFPREEILDGLQSLAEEFGLNVI